LSPAKPKAAFLDFATLGPAIDTGALDELLDVAYYSRSDPADVPERLEESRVAIVNKAVIGREAMDRARALELIVLAATGTDNVDVAAAAERGIAVANIRGYCTASVVQHVFALVLTLTQRLREYDALLRDGAWQLSESFALLARPIRELSGRTLGIVGYGTLGQAVAAAGACFGMRILISARPRGGGTPGEGRVPFASVLAESDVLSLHCPLTSTTRHLLGRAELAAMKSDALLINTARGALVDGEALVSALRERQIGGAGIDVLPTEPPPANDPVLCAGMANLIVTPHIAWAAQESRQRALDQVAENVADFFRGGRLRRVI
jgi:glycerate dehydrogenase